MGSEGSTCVLTFQADGRPQRIALEDRELVLGRHPSCDVVIDSEGVSRRHASVAPEGESWILTDLGSMNGVSVNGVPVARQALRDGDRIDLGSVCIEVAITGAAESRPARVVFEEGKRSTTQTEFLDMGQLDAGLSGLDGAAAKPAARTGKQAVEPVSGPWRSVRLFSEAAASLLASDSLDEMLERILTVVFDNLPAERAVICLHDETTGSTTPKVMRTRQGVPDEPMRISRHIADTAMKDKQAVLVRDTATDERFHRVDSIMTMNIHSAMCAPLYRDDRAAGFIYVDNQGSEKPFSPFHLQVLSTLAILSAVAVEQGSLRERLRREQEIRARLSRYSSPGVVDRLLKGGGRLEREMMAEEAEVSVLFADLTNFTAMAEWLSPVEVIRILNRVFERLTSAVFEFEGTLDKFRGDGMMAYFGAPLRQADHAERAVRAALRMRECLAELNEAEPSRAPISMRIGINSGRVVAGDVGSPQRKDATVVGDTVNIASRLEATVAQRGQIVIGRSTYELVGSRFYCSPLEEVQLKGKRRSVLPYLVLGETREEPPAEQSE